MSITKTQREKKRQLGQFLTPIDIAKSLVNKLSFNKTDKVLEPSMGDGSFIIPLIEQFILFYKGTIRERLEKVLQNNIYGIEIDELLYERCLTRIKSVYGFCPEKHNLIREDFFRCSFGPYKNIKSPLGSKWINTSEFDVIIGNPPFGGTLDVKLQDLLDRAYGFRNGEKIKKETYSFFIVKSLDLLRKGGHLKFICSDTFLTIKTMRGLRRLLMLHGVSSISRIDHFSNETAHPMVVLDFIKNGPTDSIIVNDIRIEKSLMELTGNFSWTITSEFAKYFNGPLLGDFLVATSGMTIGKNEMFIRPIEQGYIYEPYKFEFFNEPITLANERSRARLGYLSQKTIKNIMRLEQVGAVRKNIRVIKRMAPLKIQLPNPDYCYYNKATKSIIYCPPTHVIFWQNEGEAVLTFKRSGNWYLHGVGGQPFFKREGITWRLISTQLDMRYLPPGYILDSGAPCAFLRKDVAKDELYFVLAWTLTPLCNHILKRVINHTKNNQSKDFEKLPYPWWVSASSKEKIVKTIRYLVLESMKGKQYTRTSPELLNLAILFQMRNNIKLDRTKTIKQSSLFENRLK